MSLSETIPWLDANHRLLTAEFVRLRECLLTASGGDRSIAEERVESELRAARAALEEPPAIDRVATTFDLTDFERGVLLLAAGVEMDSTLASLCAAESIPQRRGSGLDFGLAMAVLPSPHWSALTPLRPLRRWRLVELEGGGGITGATLRIDERVLHALAGIDQIDPRLSPLLRHHPSPGRVADAHRVLAERCADAVATRDHPRAVILSGNDAEGKVDVAAFVAARLGLPLFVLRLSDVPASATEQHALATLWQREAALLPAALFVDAAEIVTGGTELAPFLQRLGGLVLVGVPEAVDVPQAWSGRVDRPTPTEQRSLWNEALAESLGREEAGSLRPAVDLVAAQFRLSAKAIDECVESWKRAGTPVSELAGRMWRECSRRARPRLDGLAQRLDTSATWDDLVLPAEKRATLDQIAAQIRRRTQVHTEWGFERRGSRGLGISALFSGESGVGKTMACEVIARELELDLYRIDLSAVVSKYIGETEKNLRRVFDAAEDTACVLLFDEADALFGKRSEVKDSHDRYANIEVSYLLQRMEAYRGLAVLTTNQRAALDPAFLRRFRFVVVFPYPDAEERERIWRRIFPAGTPCRDLEFAKLARLQMTGGNIRNIALTAAFLAAEDGEAVRLGHLARAAHQEAAKLERPLSEAQTRDW